MGKCKKEGSAIPSAGSLLKAGVFATTAIVAATSQDFTGIVPGNDARRYLRTGNSQQKKQDYPVCGGAQDKRNQRDYSEYVKGILSACEKGSNSTNPLVNSTLSCQVPPKPKCTRDNSQAGFICGMIAIGTFVSGIACCLCKGRSAQTSPVQHA